MKNHILDVTRTRSGPSDRAAEKPPHRSNSYLQNGEALDLAGSLEARVVECLGSDAAAMSGVLREALLQPVAEMVWRPGKRVRGQLVRLCYRLVAAESAPSLQASRRCQIGADVIELIHAGSLIVDDIEDGSQERRGAPALHLQFGTPIALNAGNWLYFWPFQVLKEMNLSSDRLLYLYERYHAALLKAHVGQAVDLGAQVDTLPQPEVAAICTAALRLKTGALTSFAAVIGGAIGGASDSELDALDEFGSALGVALQMFDDLGNLLGRNEPGKRYEDLLLRRPSWVWACAANSLLPADYRRFVEAVRELPDTRQLERQLAQFDIVALTRASARLHLDRAFLQLENRLVAGGTWWSAASFNELRQLGEEIAIAYG